MSFGSSYNPFPGMRVFERYNSPYLHTTYEWLLPSYNLATNENHLKLFERGKGVRLSLFSVAILICAGEQLDFSSLLAHGVILHK